MKNIEVIRKYINQQPLDNNFVSFLCDEIVSDCDECPSNISNRCSLGHNGFLDWFNQDSDWQGLDWFNQDSDWRGLNPEKKDLKKEEVHERGN